MFKSLVLKCRDNGRWTRLDEDLFGQDSMKVAEIIGDAINRIISRERPGHGYYGPFRMDNRAWHDIANGRADIVVKISRSIGGLCEHIDGDTMEFYLDETQ